MIVDCIRDRKLPMPFKRRNSKTQAFQLQISLELLDKWLNSIAKNEWEGFTSGKRLADGPALRTGDTLIRCVAVQ